MPRAADPRGCRAHWRPSKHPPFNTWAGNVGGRDYGHWGGMHRGWHASKAVGTFKKILDCVNTRGQCLNEVTSNNPMRNLVCFPRANCFKRSAGAEFAGSESFS